HFTRAKRSTPPCSYRGPAFGWATYARTACPSSAVPLVQSECEQRIARSHQQILMAVEHVRLRRVRHLTDVRVPQNLSVGRIVGHDVATEIAAEEQLARGGE